MLVPCAARPGSHLMIVTQYECPSYENNQQGDADRPRRPRRSAHSQLDHVLLRTGFQLDRRGSLGGRITPHLIAAEPIVEVASRRMSEVASSDLAVA